MRKNLILTAVLASALTFGTAAYAGNPGQGDGGCGNHGGFFQKMKQSFKKGYKAGKKAGTKAYDSVQNKVADTGVAAKKALTGKKCKTFVKGHYTKKDTHVKGHYRKVGQCKKNS